MIAEAQIQAWFTYHPPTKDQTIIYETVRAHARELAHILNNLVPDGADKSDAMRKLREVVMTANAAIATAEAPAPPVASRLIERAEDLARARKADARSPYQTTAGFAPKTSIVAASTALKRKSAKTLDDLVTEYVNGRS